MTRPLKVVIVGGGTAGWMCATGLAGAVRPGLCDVTLIESDEIATVGVGEATLPQLKDFNDFVGIDEVEFMRNSNATFKLGIDFVDWGKKGNRYMHPFGVFGQPMGGVAFHHLWMKAKQAGLEHALEDYSYPIVATRTNRFEFPSEDKSSVSAAYAYAYHFDAFLYVQFLRGFTQARGVKRQEGLIVETNLDPDTGYIRSVTLASGQVIEGDLFIDCSGFRALLIDKAMKTEFEDWSKWLPNNRAFAVICERNDENFTPYTRSTAREAGWQWRIPLQHRTGNGYAYSSSFISDDEARQTLLDNLDGKALNDPWQLKFVSGRRKDCWVKNCVAIGLASGFLEPLESTSIYLIQMGVIHLIRLLPRGPEMEPVAIEEYKRSMDVEYQRIRDFLILHYHANERDDAELWRYTRNMDIPDSLKEKIAAFRHRGHVPFYKDGLFAMPSWVSVFYGQGITPENYDPLTDNMELEAALARMRDMHEKIRTHTAAMPSHDEFIRGYCPAVDTEVRATRKAGAR
ncbi:tryptophan halogenase family protein [Asticcacaulis tiandongensis]|uniref:tryptophan halogenase family protein n=1 Tax=Asticcacaulis tiandongensis TaxID=2565365 RepID=UPI00112EE102|nr:tryptophan halogenase family protein [Asticcacaulis tiandongensis]